MDWTFEIRRFGNRTTFENAGHPDFGRSLYLDPDRYFRAHNKYIDNLMRLAGYMRADRRTLLQIVISRLVELDAHLPQQVCFVQLFILWCDVLQDILPLPNQGLLFGYSLKSLLSKGVVN